jgi:hypothetical protein
MCVAEDTEKCRAVVNTAMKLLISCNTDRETFREFASITVKLQHAKIISGERVI